MGNCTAKQKKSSAEIAPSDVVKGSPSIRLYGSSSCPRTFCIRIALLYKTVSLQFIPSENPNFVPDTVLQCGSDTVSGSYQTLLQYIESRFPNPPLLPRVGSVRREPAIVAAARLQHKSMTWHLDRMMRGAAELALKQTRGVRIAVDPSMGSPRMEVRKFGRSYSQLLEVLLEHAQMEERIIFPILEKADRGLCKAANEEHARDLPIMNGIKEAIKSIGVLETGSPAYQEAMLNLSTRLTTLQEHCREHFEEEEKGLLPLLEGTEISKEREEGMLVQCFEVMEGSHSHLFHFLMAGLLPRDAMLYLDLVCTCMSRQRVASILQVLTTRMEGKESLIWDWDP
ncbi:hemerythrin HHE cation-binding domain protein [Tasmannia lanceolata]|uniref:hemerythrin HHE cation-binding domain protein n=1 Tax=Tasmannia lanceolata TaxID=3420 RepID=UPI004063F334